MLAGVHGCSGAMALASGVMWRGLAAISAAGRARFRRRDFLPGCKPARLGLADGGDACGQCSLLEGTVAVPLPFLPDAPGENPRSYDRVVAAPWCRSLLEGAILEFPRIASLRR